MDLRRDDTSEFRRCLDGSGDHGMKYLAYFIITLMFFASCQKSVDNKTTEFIVRVDSVVHPSFAASNDTIPVRFFGTIGNDGCCSFSHFAVDRATVQLDITVWGQRSNSLACPAVMVYLDGRHYDFVPGQLGWFKIIVHQPDGSTIKDSVIVK